MELDPYVEETKSVIPQRNAVPPSTSVIREDAKDLEREWRLLPSTSLEDQAWVGFLGLGLRGLGI